MALDRNHSQHHARREQDDHHPERTPPGALVGVSPRFVIERGSLRAAQPPLDPELECTATTTVASQPIF